MSKGQSFERIRPCVVCGVYFFPLQADVDHVRAQGKHPDTLMYCVKHRPGSCFDGCGEPVGCDDCDMKDE